MVSFLVCQVGERALIHSCDVVVVCQQITHLYFHIVPSLYTATLRIVFIFILFFFSITFVTLFLARNGHFTDLHLVNNVPCPAVTVTTCFCVIAQDRPTLPIMELL